MPLATLKPTTIGTNVDIQRSDGRVHSAVIRSINKANLTVTVEWYENRETKGKEIDIDKIFELNPSFGSDEPVAGNMPKYISADNKPSNEEKNVNFRNLPILKKSMKNNENIELNVAQLTKMFNVPSNATDGLNKLKLSIIAPENINDVSFSMVNSSFGWIKGNVYKNVLRQSSSLKEVERIQQNRDKRRSIPKHLKDQNDFDPLNPNFDFLTMIRDYQRSLTYSPLTNQDIVEKHQICVCVRKRPLNRIENSRKEIDVISIPNKQSVVVHEPKLKVDLTKYLENQQFRFDYAFDENVDNTIVYRFTARPLVECLFERGMATCFAYGQTGSGKTHTMGGEFQCKGVQNCSNGIYALAGVSIICIKTARDVFRLLNTKYRIEELYVECAFFEIYSGKVFDLLNKKERLRILEDHRGKVQIIGLKCEIVDNVEEVLKIIQHGTLIRVSGHTSANQNSSRSHAVFQIILRKKVSKKLYGKFSLIDLAGNERGADTSSSDKITRMEGAEINKSLLALKECIRALGKKSIHRPFRTSKLTQILRDSFIGDQSQTCMISTISPGMQSYEHTLNTLRYADRVKELGPGNMDTNDAVLPSIPSTPISGSGDENIFEDLHFIENSYHFSEESDDRLTPTKLDPQPIENQNIKKEGNQDMETSDVEDENTLQNENINIEGKNIVKLDHKESIYKDIPREEDLFMEHSTFTDKLPQWLQTHNELYKMTEYGEFNVSDYAMKLGTVLTEQINELIRFKDRLTNLRSEMRIKGSKSVLREHMDS